MLQLVRVFAASALVVSLCLAGHVFAAARLEPLTVGYSNITATYAPLWLVVEEHVGVKYGLDLKAIYAGRVRPQQLLATGEVIAAISAGETDRREPDRRRDVYETHRRQRLDPGAV